MLVCVLIIIILDEECFFQDDQTNMAGVKRFDRLAETNLNTTRCSFIKQPTNNIHYSSHEKSSSRSRPCPNYQTLINQYKSEQQTFEIHAQDKKSSSVTKYSIRR